MALGEQSQAGAGPVGLTPPGGSSWMRLVTAAFAVAISLAMTWRDGRPARPAPVSPAQAQEQSAPPVERAAEPLPDDAAAAGTQVACLAPPQPVAIVAGPPRQQHVTGAVPVSHHWHKADRRNVKGRPASARRPGRASGPLRRSEVRAEYIAAREQVAALTGEDSGSAYLQRTAGRREGRASPEGARRQRVATRG